MSRFSSRVSIFVLLWKFVYDKGIAQHMQLIYEKLELLQEEILTVAF